ncbi:ABC1 kinase family protein [Tumebacillus permanentifrigoris]|uniref:Putative unusual protein kinase regulating ubiquinone biosynthesis (AarF/ABC1/UbiB family) n=1 Tax=Tumebacillus permanentifrigoris TaxID=378543 RepID=A0A316DB75_9BACL|nr:AarF/UbiB family protein [Tumebacillus permanentifrigoris]PWK13866.1 putative unusual protein kinase regulating ubiquinone biosynthesis (AarF/ABC1/UbiB family) [Tumebacillus permanentifrigoris]
MKRNSLYRISTIVFMFTGFFLRVIWFQKRNPGKMDPATQAKWEDLLRKIAFTYKRKSLQLEGLLIKLGQFLSARADVVPQVVIQELTDLVDQVPAVPWDLAKQVLESEWEAPYGSVLHKISEKPVASASIGEVYKAYLHTGEEVAVKIQRPGIEKIIRADFRAIRIVCWLAAKFTKIGKTADLPALYREMTYVIGDELNFKQELKNGEYFAQRYQDNADLYIPRYYGAHCTRRVLVMEWMEGARINDYAYMEQHGIDRAEIAVKLFNAVAEQLFFEGKFHADPHPGNILVQPDGRIVLIDFGMVGTIKKQDAAQIQGVVEGLVLKDFSRVIESLEKLRFLLPHANRSELERVLELVVQFYEDEDMANVDYELVQHITDDIQSVMRQQPIQLPSEFIFLGRAVSTFIGVLYGLNPQIDLMEVGKPIINEWLSKNGGDQAGVGGGSSGTWKTVQKYALDIGRQLLKLPRQLSESLEEPRRRREWDKVKQKNQFLHEVYTSRKRYAFATALMGLAVAGVGYYFVADQYLLWGGGGLALVSAFWYRSSAVKHLRWIEELK